MSMSSLFGWLHYPALVLLVPAVLGLVLTLAMDVAPRHGDRHNNGVIRLLQYAVLLGLLCKLGMIGPEWLRYYLSDLGMPVVIALLLTGGPLSRHAEDPAWLISSRIGLLYAGLGICLGYELLVGLFYLLSGWPAWLLGGFDVVDVLLYVVGALVALLASGIRLERGGSLGATLLDPKLVARRGSRRLVRLRPTGPGRRRRRRRGAREARRRRRRS